MKAQLSILIFLLFNIFASGQTQLLKDYDFENGGYCLVGIHSPKLKNYKNPLEDIFEDFYTNDTSILNKFKKDWVFTKSKSGLKCDFNYAIFICKNGASVEQFNINLTCNEITCSKGTFFFDLIKLSSFKGKLKKAYRKTDEFNTVKQAREYRNSLAGNKDLIFIIQPLWIEYDGLFSFDGTNGDSLTIKEISLTHITTQIKKVYPEEKFEVEDLGDIYVGVKCQKAFSKKFKLYPIWAEWAEYEPALTTFWMNDKK